MIILAITLAVIYILLWIYFLFSMRSRDDGTSAANGRMVPGSKGEDRRLLLLEDARSSIENGEYEGALAILDRSYDAGDEDIDEALRSNIEYARGVCLYHIGVANMVEGSLIEAVDSFEAALRFAQGRVQVATIITYVGETRSVLSMIRDRSLNLKRAFDAYETAGETLTRDAHPKGYARLQNNLGLAYLRMSSLSDAQTNAAKAIEAFECALDIWSSDPRRYAMVKHNIGDAYLRLAGTNDEELDRARSAFEEALRTYTIVSYPYDFAYVQERMGAMYRLLADVREQETNLGLAIDSYDRASMILTIDSRPYDHATVQVGIAVTNVKLSQITGSSEHIERAFEAFDVASSVFTLDSYPYDHSRTMCGMADAYLLLSELEDPEANRRRAREALGRAIIPFADERDSIEYRSIIERIEGIERASIPSSDAT